MPPGSVSGLPGPTKIKKITKFLNKNDYIYSLYIPYIGVGGMGAALFYPPRCGRRPQLRRRVGPLSVKLPSCTLTVQLLVH